MFVDRATIEVIAGTGGSGAEASQAISSRWSAWADNPMPTTSARTGW